MKLNNKGLEIIKKYEPDAEINVGHDQIWVGSYTAEKMTPDELTEMEENGWFEEDECWSHFI